MKPRLNRSPVAAHRIRAGYATALDGSRALGCSRIYLLEIESGRSVPSARLFQLMVDRFRVKPDRLQKSLDTVRRDLLRRQMEQLNGDTP